MPDKIAEGQYPLIDADPHASRVLRYMRPSDLGVWAAATGAFPAALYFWGERIDIICISVCARHPGLTRPLKIWQIPQKRT